MINKISENLIHDQAACQKGKECSFEVHDVNKLVWKKGAKLKNLN